MPRNLAGAFEKPIVAGESKSLSGLSVEALMSKWEAFDRAFGRPRREWVALLNLTDGEISYHKDALHESLESALRTTMEGVRTLLKVS